jgi:hypothetical protein
MRLTCSLVNSKTLLKDKLPVQQTSRPNNEMTRSSFQVSRPEPSWCGDESRSLSAKARGDFFVLLFKRWFDANRECLISCPYRSVQPKSKVQAKTPSLEFVHNGAEYYTGSTPSHEVRSAYVSKFNAVLWSI